MGVPRHKCLLRRLDYNGAAMIGTPHGDPVGSEVAPGEGAERPRRRRLSGRFVTLAPVDPKTDLEELYACSHGGAEVERLWTYLPYGPFASQEAMRRWLVACAASADPLFLAVTDLGLGRRVGMTSFLSIVPAMRRLELGHIWYAPTAQRTKVNTEAMYLMLGESFDRLACRRVEWKCNALNERSRAAALRLGFAFEGVFRQHMIVKGRNRDSAWFAMIDRDWPAIKANMERWLYAGEPGLSLAKLNAPFAS
jgi:RimJ/RimL family protein N-acetyltransferase